MISHHQAVLQKLLDGHGPLGKDEIHVLRVAARHPDFAGKVSRSLEAAADLHEAARLSDEGAARRALTSGEIQRDIARVIGAPYPPRRSRR